jgi:hypothetical protein
MEAGVKKEPKCANSVNMEQSNSRINLHSIKKMWLDNTRVGWGKKPMPNFLFFPFVLIDSQNKILLKKKDLIIN